jgi:hypothetical protein
MIIPSVSKYKIYGFVIAEDKKEADVVTNVVVEKSAPSPSKGSRPIKKASSQSKFGSKRSLSFNFGHDSEDKGRNIAQKIEEMRERRETETSNSEYSFPGGTDSDDEDDTSEKKEKSADVLWQKSKEKILRASSEDEEEATTSSLSESHWMNEEPRSLIKATIDSVADLDSCSGHVILLGTWANLYHFVLPMRSKHLERIQKIIILTPSPPSFAAWSKLSYFKELYYCQGSALELEDLDRVSIKTASRVVVFAKEYDESDGSLEALVDADTIFSYRVITKANEDIQIVCELVAQSNISFLSEEISSNEVFEDHYLSPPFAAGHVYTASMLDTLICQAYYNPHIITILRQIVAGEDVPTAKQFNRKMKHVLGEVNDSHLFQIEVPKKFYNKPYGDVVTYLITKQHMVPLALRRGINKKIKVGQNGNKFPYVYTNPSHDVRVFKNDVIFVLAQKPPQDINAGIRRASYAWDENAHLLAESASRVSVSGSSARPRGSSLIGANTSAREILLNMREEIQSQMTALFNDVNTLTSRLSSLEKQVSIEDSNEDEQKSGSGGED